MLRWFEYGQVYHPTKEWDTFPSDLRRPFQDIFITTSDDVRLSAWFFPADETSPRRNLAFVICHGNGGNISHRPDVCRVLLATGANVLLFDYRGYGRSDGELNEEGTYCDAQAAHAWLRQQGFASIIAFGESLGAAVAAELALRETVTGLVLQGAFTSIADIGAEIFPWLPVRWFNTLKYDTLAKVPRVRVPVMVLHSRDDEIVRFRHAERIFAAAHEPKLLWELHGGHNDSLEMDSQRANEALEKFLRMLTTANHPLRAVT